MKFGVDYAHNTEKQHYSRRKCNSGIKSCVEEEMPCKTQVINNAQGQAPPQRTLQRFVTLLKAIVGLLWLKFVRSLVQVSAMGARGPSSKTSCSFKKFRPDEYPGCQEVNKKTARVRISGTLLARYEKEGDAFLHRIVTCDETWVHHYTLEPKRASKEWRRMGEKCPVKAKGGCQPAK